MQTLFKLPIFLFEKILFLLYPPNCIICGKTSKKYLCKKCEIKIERNAIYKIDTYKNKFFSKHAYCFKYDKNIRNLIIDYKFNDKSYMCEIFANFLLKNKKICRFFENYDIIISVPIHKKRKALRGYNQSELVTKIISNKYSNLQLNENILYKQKNTVKQSSLTKEKRIENVKNVYKINNKETIKDKKIIIIDDIYTTGSTVNECAKILKLNGAKDVVIITIAKD